MTSKQNNTSFQEIEKHLSEIPFQIIDSPLFYAAYFKSDTESALYFKQHHLISDAWSIILSANKTFNYYLLLKNNEDIDNIQEPSFIDYLDTEKEYLKSERFLSDKIFWKEKIQTIPEVIYLKNKPKQSSTRGERISFCIPEEISIKITKFCKETNISLLVLFTAIFSIYIYKTTSKKSVALGTTILNRRNLKEKNTLGMFINMIPVFLHLDESLNFKSYLSYILSEWMYLLYSSRYPYDFMIDEYRQQYQVSSDLFDVTITYQNAVHNHLEGFGDVVSYWHPYGHQTNSLNINISNRINTNCYIIDFDYLLDLFTAKEIESLNNHLLNILIDAIEYPEKSITSFELLTESEKYKLIYDFNNTKTVCKEQNLSELFESQVIQNPNNVAIIFENQQLTYNELNKKANQIAWMLRKKGVKSNSIVGLLTKRSFEMIIGILGILKAGGAYLPIDSTHPMERIKYILDDSNCNILLTNIPSIESIDWKGCTINLNNLSIKQHNSNLANINQSTDLAYIIYTSGSTGQPKGVMIEHHSIVNTIEWRTRHYGFCSQDILLQIPPYNFDSSVEDIFSFLTVGAAIVLIDQDKRLDLNYLENLIINYKITHFLATPLLYKAMLDEISNSLINLNSVTIAGENFQFNLVKKHFEKLPQVKLYNEYGPTENSVCSTVYQFSSSDKEVLIGKPIDNTYCYVLNQELQLQPLETTGELYIGGSGIARGYLNNPKLTNENFIFVPCIGKYLYKTGDLVQWTNEGNLKFFGRIDNQVKIRGYRIELLEIESHLLKHESVKEAILMVREDEPGKKYLCAYIILNSYIPISEIKAFLSKYLPDYMIPLYFVPLEKIPLSPNGKTNWTALPAPNINLKMIYDAPRNKLEEKMAKVWSEVLGLEKIGINDDFFELGGDSLAVIRVLAMTHNYNWNLKAQDFYQYRSIKKISEHILNHKTDTIYQLEKTFSTTDLNNFNSTNKIAFIEKRSVKNLFLTGATGFLGIHLLYELIQLDNVKIYCLIRGKSENDARLRLYQLIKFYFPHLKNELVNEKVVIVNGDLTEEYFKLSEATYNHLLTVIDTVIHTAALVKHYGDYSEFKKINVYGTQNILQFSQNKFLVHISTTSISGDYAEQKFDSFSFSEKCLDIGQDFAGNYYVQTKFEAEKIVAGYFSKGFHGIIIRVGNLTGRYSNGVFQINISENKFYGVLKSMIQLTMLPRSFNETEIEFTPVDLCSSGIIKLLKSPVNNKTFHLFNNNFIKVERLCTLLDNLGYNIKIVNDLCFYNKIKKMLNNDPNSYKILSWIITDFNNGKLNFKPSVFIDSTYTITTLKQLGFKWPLVDILYLEKIIKYMQSVQFIDKGVKNHEKKIQHF